MKMFVAGQWVDKARAIEVQQSVRRLGDRHRAEGRCRRRRAGAGRRGRRGRDHADHKRLRSVRRSCRKAAELMAATARQAGPADQHAKKARSWPRACSKSRAPEKRSSFRPKRPSGSAAKCCRSTAHRAARASSASRCACRAAWWWRSRRSTFRSTWCATRSGRRWPPATP